MSTQTAEQAFEKQKKQRLIVGILFDLLGMATYAFPALGEVGDLAWAPIAAATFFSMYRGATGIIGGSFVFIEEIIPFTDILPTFTITWLWVYQINGAKNKAKFLKNQESAVSTTNGTVDITHLQDDKKLPA
jgi:hypothetical protein